MGDHVDITIKFPQWPPLCTITDLPAAFSRRADYQASHDNGESYQTSQLTRADQAAKMAQDRGGS